MAHADAELLVHTPTRAAVASWIGSALEYYDFFIYGTAAALVFGKIFFPNENPAAGLLCLLVVDQPGYIALIFVFGIAMSGIAYGASNAIWPAFYGEMFDTRVRLSGMAIPTQIGFALAGFAPTIAAALQGGDVTAWMPVAVVTLAACVIAAASAATARETYKLDLDELGVPAAAVPSNLVATA